jgi:co-chaperonin GroES (HSP10)
MSCRFEKKIKFSCPFIVDGKVKFPIKPLNAGLFMWPDPLPQKVGSLFIPEDYQENYRNSIGIVLAIGPGFFSRKRDRFIPTEVKPGDRVVFDTSVPWRIPVEGPDGKDYVCWGLAEVDVKGMINCKDCERYSFCHS